MRILIILFLYRDLSCAKTAWLDCVEEDEEYLGKNNFYEKCTTFDYHYGSSDAEKCFNDRCRPVDESNPLESGDPATLFYPGYDTAVRKPKAKKNLKNKYQGNVHSISHRPVRSIYEKKPLFTLQAHNCRIIQSINKDRRRRCDRIIETRSLDYIKATELFPPGVDLTEDGSDFDLSKF